MGNSPLPAAHQSARSLQVHRLLDGLVLILVLLGEGPVHDGTQEVRVQFPRAGGSGEETHDESNDDDGEAAQHVEVQVGETVQHEGLLWARSSAQTVVRHGERVNWLR